jgi:hypothetical protein
MLAGETGETLKFEQALRLIDYLALQLWFRKFCFARGLSLFVVMFVCAILVIDIIAGMTPSEIRRETLSNWRITGATFLGSYLFAMAFPFFAITLRWYANKLPQCIRISLDTIGLTHSTADHDLRLYWSGLKFLAETKSAYIAKFARIVVRIPKRDLSAPQLERLADFLRKVIPPNLNRTHARTGD